MNGSLHLSVDLPDGRPGEEPFTTATFMVRIDGEPVWPVQGAEIDLDMQLDDLLSNSRNSGSR